MEPPAAAAARTPPEEPKEPPTAAAASKPPEELKKLPTAAAASKPPEEPKEPPSAAAASKPPEEPKEPGPHISMSVVQICQADFRSGHIYWGGMVAARHPDWFLSHDVGLMVRCTPAWEVPEAGAPPPKVVEQECVLLASGCSERLLQQLRSLVESTDFELLRLRRGVLLWSSDGVAARMVAACLVAKLFPHLGPKEVLEGIEILTGGAVCGA
jgi:hypothetical protein